MFLPNLVHTAQASDNFDCYGYPKISQSFFKPVPGENVFADFCGC